VVPPLSTQDSSSAGSALTKDASPGGKHLVLPDWGIFLYFWGIIFSLGGKTGGTIFWGISWRIFLHAGIKWWNSGKLVICRFFQFLIIVFSTKEVRYIVKPSRRGKFP
jgi:hypothetical protein